MVNIFKTIVLFSLFCLTACNSKGPTADDGIYFQDFDNLYWWSNDQWNLTSEKAHSGDFSARTDSLNEFSQTFAMDYDYALAKKCSAIQVSAWICVTNMNAKAGLVVSVESAKGAAAYESVDIKNFITAPNQWDEVAATLKLPEKAPEGSKIKVYLWSPSKTKIFLDDVTIKLVK